MDGEVELDSSLTILTKVLVGYGFYSSLNGLLFFKWVGWRSYEVYDTLP